MRTLPTSDPSHRSLHPWRRAILLIAFFVFCPGARAEETPYLDAVRKTADALLTSALDQYGKERSGMILSVLDCETAKPTRLLPQPPFGVRHSDRTGPGGSNANLQLDLYRTLFHLGRLTGDPRYGEAAKIALVDFMKITQHPETGLLAWGEHLYWNCVEDRLGDLDPNRTHEQKRSFVFFDEMLDWNRAGALAYAEGLWNHQIADQKTGDFSRHAKYDRHDPRKGYDFPKEGGYFIDLWSQSYGATKDPRWIEPVRVLARRYLSRTNKRGLLDFDTSGEADRVNWSVTLANLSLAVDAAAAAPRMDPDTTTLLQELVEKLDRGFLGLAHRVSDPSLGFICYAFTDTGAPRPLERKQSDGYSPAWTMGYGINTTAMFALLCHTRQEQLGAGESGDAYRRLILEAARIYQTVPPDPEKSDLWAGEYGTALFAELAAFRLTRDPSFLESAKEIGDNALGVFWEKDHPLPRASSRTRHYEAITYPDTLLLALLALHEATAGLPMEVEISDLVR